jgi:nicotinamide-nucleotide amidase
VFFHTVVWDNPARLKQAVEIAKNRADIIITTGGLGPTFDDLTKQTLAEAFGKKLIFNEEVADQIREYFAMRLHNIKMTENNLRQAELPEGCVIFDNGVGTAPGCAFEAEGKHVLMLPGPPRECRAMLKSCVAPYLQKLSESEIHSHNIHIFGLGESAVEEKLRDLMENLHNPTLAPYAKSGEVMLRLTAKAATKDETDKLMAPVLCEVRETLGDIIYGIDTDSLENTVAGLLIERGLTLAAAESCTGGLLSKRLTDIPGASRFFMGGVVTYSTQTKTSLLGVDPELINKNGVVSREVALAMADGARLKLGADIGIGITGIAGPDSDGSGLEPGCVFIALTTKDAAYCRNLKLSFDRERVRVMSASHALDMVRRLLTGLKI